MDLEHEKMIISNFFNKRIQRRLFYEIEVPKKRRKIFERLASTPEESLDKRYVNSFELKNGMGPNDIMNILVKNGAPKDKCYIMSYSSDLDGKYVTLKEAIDTLVYEGVPLIISCIPGKLAYFEGEEGFGPPPRYILKRKF